LNPLTLGELPVAVQEKEDPEGVDCRMMFVVPLVQTEDVPALAIMGSGLITIKTRVGEGAVHPVPAV
jgi:hypothetical protein